MSFLCLSMGQQTEYIVLMTKEGSIAIVNSMTTVAVVFVLGRVPITSLLS